MVLTECVMVTTMRVKDRTTTSTPSMGWLMRMHEEMVREICACYLVGIRMNNTGAAKVIPVGDKQ